mmetsp:Transcript_9636/g.11288  ORF Transcript_9636/g.11288 Transcript_9636/m.11288 type:complete len:332 (+) Transcript_9636:43-1038(+)
MANNSSSASATAEGVKTLDAAKAKKIASANNKRGAIGNILGLSILLGVSYPLDLMPYAALSLFLQFTVFFLHGLPYRSEKFYDISGSATHFALVFTSVTADESQVRTRRQMFLAMCSVVWMTRLGTFLYLRVLRDGKDERFDPVKPHALRFAAFWTVQAVWVFLIQLPVLLLNNMDDTTAEQPIGTTSDYYGLVEIILIITWFVGFTIEYIADTAKMDFRNKPENRHKYLTDGIWSVCRHPNYFGEILMWTCMAGVTTVAAIEHRKWYLLSAWLSPAFTAFLLFKVTGIPLVGKAGMKRWGDDPVYRHYIDNTSLIVPWRPAPAFDATKIE